MTSAKWDPSARDLERSKIVDRLTVATLKLAQTRRSQRRGGGATLEDVTTARHAVDDLDAELFAFDHDLGARE